MSLTEKKAAVTNLKTLLKTQSDATKQLGSELKLAGKALEAGLSRFVDPEELEAFLARVDFASQHSKIQIIGE